MATPPTRVLATFTPEDEQRAGLVAVLGEMPGVELRFLPEIPTPDRAQALAAAQVLLCWHWTRELEAADRAAAAGVRLVQFLSAGLDHVPFHLLPPGALVAGNVGAYAEPMAEHGLAMALALLKRLPQGHAELARGEFPQLTLTRQLAGAVVGVLGLGGAGRATAQRMLALGATVQAINRTGQTDAPVQFCGTLTDLERVLRAADVVVITLPLTRATRHLIGVRELGWMKDDAILVNVARAAIVEEGALYRHLLAHPLFSAGLDPWWVEPFRDEAFRVDHPFFELANVLGSPHNSGMVAGAGEVAARRAAENVRRFLRGEQLRGLGRAEDYRPA